MAKLYIDLKFRSDKKPGNFISFVRLQTFLYEKIRDKFPGYDVEVGCIEADWPDSDKEFPKCEQDDYVFVKEE